MTTTWGIQQSLSESESEALSHVRTLCNPMGCSQPGSIVHGIFEARILEWVAIFFSRGSFPNQGSKPGLPQCRQTHYPLSHQGSLSGGQLFTAGVKGLSSLLSKGLNSKMK